MLLRYRVRSLDNPRISVIISGMGGGVRVGAIGREIVIQDAVRRVVGVMVAVGVGDP